MNIYENYLIHNLQLSLILEKDYLNFEQTLTKKIAQGDHLAFRELFDRYKDVLFGYSYKLTKSQALAEEAVQEIFMKVWQNRKELNSHLSIKAYLFKIAQNHNYNILRKATYSDQLKKQIFYRCQNEYFSTEDQVIYLDLENFKNQAIATLPPKRKQIFQMSRVQGLSHAEIALQLGISQNTVKDQIGKAMKTIKKQLQIHADVALATLLASCFFL